MSLIALDIETECALGCTTKCDHALYPHTNRITAIGLWPERLVLRGPPAELRIQLMARFTSHTQLVAQEGRFDFKNLVLHGVLTEEEALSLWAFDTKLMAYVHQSKIPEEWLARYNSQRPVHVRPGTPHSLKTLAPYFLGVAPYWEPKDGDMNNDEYVLKDVEYTLALYHYLSKELTPQEHSFVINCLMRWAKELLRAEIRGVAFDVARLAQDEAHARIRLMEVEEKLHTAWAPVYAQWRERRLQEVREAYAQKRRDWREKHGTDREAYYAQLQAKAEAKADLSFNLASPSQLLWALRDYFRLDVVNLGGQESTGREVLEGLAQNHPDIGLLLEYRKWSKLVTAFYPSYRSHLRQGRIHTSFNTSDTRTGRLSSSAPNCQQQPKETRHLFVPDREHSFIIRDLSAIEPTLIAYYSEDSTLLDIVVNGRDFHGATASAIFPYIDVPNQEIKAAFPRERRTAKTAGLAILYGAGARRLHQTLIKDGFLEYTEQDCRRMVQNIREFYSGVWAFKQELDRALEAGDVVYNLLGRPIRFEVFYEVYMKGFNRLIQSSASDLVLEALTLFNEWGRPFGAQALLAIHDEIVAQAPDEIVQLAAEKLEEVMTSFSLMAGGQKIPLKVEGAIAKQWAK